MLNPRWIFTIMFSFCSDNNTSTRRLVVSSFELFWIFFSFLSLYMKPTEYDRRAHSIRSVRPSCQIPRGLFSRWTNDKTSTCTTCTRETPLLDVKFGHSERFGGVHVTWSTGNHVIPIKHTGIPLVSSYYFISERTRTCFLHGSANVFTWFSHKLSVDVPFLHGSRRIARYLRNFSSPVRELYKDKHAYIARQRNYRRYNVLHTPLNNVGKGGFYQSYTPHESNFKTASHEP